jgi:hypothetical protein
MYFIMNDEVEFTIIRMVINEYLNDILRIDFII